MQLQVVTQAAYACGLEVVDVGCRMAGWGQADPDPAPSPEPRATMPRRSHGAMRRAPEYPMPRSHALCMEGPRAVPR
jgi:hypothetical protein